MATARKTTTRRRNVAMGMTIGSGPGRVFHPFRSSSDYDPVLAGEKKKRKPAAKKKAVKKSAPKRKTTTKRVAIKKRAVVRKRTLAKKTVRRRNPPQKVYTLVWGPTGQKIATVTASNMKAAIRKAPAPYSKYKGEIYAEVSKAKNPKPRTAPANGTKVGKSKYKTTMDAASKLMPFPSKVVKDGAEYTLWVKPHNVAMARKILSGMAKTMTKKATKK